MPNCSKEQAQQLLGRLLTEEEWVQVAPLIHLYELTLDNLLKAQMRSEVASL